MGKQLDGQEVKEATLTADDLAKLRSQGKLVWGGSCLSLMNTPSTGGQVDVGLLPLHR